MSKDLNRKLEHIGWTSYHTNILFQSGFGWAHEYYWIITLSLIMEEAKSDFQANTQMKGLLGTLLLLGLAIGSYL